MTDLSSLVVGDKVAFCHNGFGIRHWSEDTIIKITKTQITIKSGGRFTKAGWEIGGPIGYRDMIHPLTDDKIELIEKSRILVARREAIRLIEGRIKNLPLDKLEAIVAIIETVEETANV